MKPSIMHLTAAFGLLSTLTLSVCGQSPNPSVSGSTPVSVLRQAHGLGWHDGALLGTGADYRATFDRGGVTFVPALGRQATTTASFRLSFESLHRGDVLLHQAGKGDHPAAELIGRSAHYVRTGVTERYAVRPNGVELSYVFDHPPAGSGDLRVRLAVHSDLAFAGADGVTPGLSFSDGAIGGVRVGGVTGIDAADRRVTGSVHYDGTHLELSLPAAFVDGAAYPMVLDPLLAPEFLVGNQTQDDSGADVAYDDTNQVYLVVWQREFAADSVELRAQRVDPSGNMVGSVMAIQSTGVSLNPTVANVSKTDQFLVCWQEGASIFGPWNIRGRTIDAATAATSAIVDIAVTTDNETHPDAGGESTDADDDAVVVWVAGNETLAAQVTCPAGANPFKLNEIVVNAGLSVASRPAISKSGGATGRFLILSTDYPILQATCVTRDLAVLDQVFLESLLASGISDADVDGDGTEFLAVWEESEGFQLPNRDVVSRRVSFSGGALSTGTKMDVGGTPNVDEIDPSVAFLGHSSVVVYSEKASLGLLTLDHDIKTAEVLTSTGAVWGPPIGLSTGTGNVDIGAAVASARSGGACTRNAMITFSGGLPTPPFQSGVWAALYEDSDLTVPVVAQKGLPCGGGGTANTNGPATPGNASFAFTLTGADPAAFAAVLNINADVPPIICGSCELLPPLTQVPTVVSNGNAILPLPIPCVQGFIGGTVQVQWWVAGTVASPCFLAPNLSLSSRINVTMTY